MSATGEFDVPFPLRMLASRRVERVLWGLNLVMIVVLCAALLAVSVWSMARSG